MQEREVYCHVAGRDHRGFHIYSRNLVPNASGAAAAKGGDGRRDEAAAAAAAADYGGGGGNGNVDDDANNVVNKNQRLYPSTQPVKSIHTLIAIHLTSHTSPSSATNAIMTQSAAAFALMQQLQVGKL